MLGEGISVPILAEIADKMPTLEAMWGLWIFIGLFTGMIVAALSLLRLRNGPRNSDSKLS